MGLLRTSGRCINIYSYKLRSQYVTILVFAALTVIYMWTKPYIFNSKPVEDSALRSEKINEPSTIAARLPLPTTEQRIVQIRKLCASFSQTKMAKLSPIEKPEPRYYVNKNKKVFYCQISKVACTTWTALLTDPNLGYRALSDNFMAVHRPSRLSRAKIISTSNYSNEYDAFTKFLVVRHPLDRLLSAYHNIIDRRSNLGPERSTVKTILSHYGGRSKNLTLSRFVDFLTTYNNSRIPGTVLYDRHWDNYEHACNICSINYNHVIYYEDMASDSKPILNTLGWPVDHLFRKNVTNPGIKMLKRNATNPFTLHLSEYKSISRKQLNLLLDRYEQDMKFFGYTFDPVTLKTGIYWTAAGKL